MIEAFLKKLVTIPISDIIMVCLGMGLLATLQTWAEPIPIKLRGTLLEPGLFKAAPVSFQSAVSLEPGTSGTFLVEDPDARYRMTVFAQAEDGSALSVRVETYEIESSARDPISSSQFTLHRGDLARMTANSGATLSEIEIDTRTP